jgi:hypothetical protein
MLLLKHTFLSKGKHGFMYPPQESPGIFSGFGIYQFRRDVASEELALFSEDATEADDRDTPLDDAAQSERDYVRQRLREELKREPTDSELDEWLRQHTEGY